MERFPVNDKSEEASHGTRYSVSRWQEDDKRAKPPRQNVSRLSSRSSLCDNLNRPSQEYVFEGIRRVQRYYQAMLHYLSVALPTFPIIGMQDASLPPWRKCHETTQDACDSHHIAIAYISALYPSTTCSLSCIFLAHCPLLSPAPTIKEKGSAHRVDKKGREGKEG